MKKITKHAIAAICVVLLLLCAPTCFADADALDSIYQATSERLLECPLPNVGSVGGEWLVIGLARAKIIPQKTASMYYENVAAYVDKIGSATLDRNKSTENSRVILALTAIGKDPTDVCGYNLLQPLSDFSFVKKQGINGPVWTLISLDSLQYDIPEGTSSDTTTREKIITYILDKQMESGGWGISSTNADLDMTGMVIQALAPYYDKIPDVKTAVDHALQFISVHQCSGGGFSEASESPERCAQIITALAALGIDLEKDDRFIKNGNSIVDCLMGFALVNGFSHDKNGVYNQMSTEQAFYALTAFNRLRQCQSSLYDMCDLLMEFDLNLDGKVDITDATLAQKAIAEIVKLSLRQLKIAQADAQGNVHVTYVTDTQRYIAAH